MGISEEGSAYSAMPAEKLEAADGDEHPEKGRSWPRTALA